MSSTVLVALDVTTRDSSASSDLGQSYADRSATSHDYVDPTPKSVSTSGAVGANFILWPTSVAQIQRVWGQIPAAADLYFRWGGDVAEVLSSLTAPGSSLTGLTLVCSVDGGSPVTTTFESGDTTLALAARRINYAHNAPIASIDAATSKLVLAGARTGGADAKAASRQYGEINITGGTALSALGLAVGTTPGAGTDERIGSGPYVRSFPSSALPRALEISGSASGLALSLAGKAS